MVAFVHMYPFSPFGAHGGTLRLQTAVDATRTLGDTEVWWWSASEQRWLSLANLDDVTGPGPSVARSGRQGRDGIKRRVFPSTLWESARIARRHAPSVPRPAHSHVVLHTTYLSPLAKRLRSADRRVFVDVYDLVWRAHAMDVREPRLLVDRIRAAYSATVKARELAALEHADGLLVAGWADLESLPHSLRPRAVWAPTGLEAPRSELVLKQNGALAVGMIGNFEHSASADSARRLLGSPAAQSQGVEIVLAGHRSEQWRDVPGVTALGSVQELSEFYDRVDSCVLPVGNGAGMKCKIGEALLAGKSAVTTPAGAAGFPPDIQAHLTVVDSESSITRDLLAAASSRSTDPTADTLDPLRRNGAAQIYRSAITERLP